MSMQWSHRHLIRTSDKLKRKNTKLLCQLWQEGVICLGEQDRLPWRGTQVLSWVLKDEVSAKDMKDGNATPGLGRENDSHGDGWS